jgi:hypothetical protein
LATTFAELDGFEAGPPAAAIRFAHRQFASGHPQRAQTGPAVE